MTNPHPPGWCRIDPGLGAAATRVPAASREDSRFQAILQFQPRNSFSYRVHYESQLNLHLTKVAKLLESMKFENVKVAFYFDLLMKASEFKSWYFLKHWKFGQQNSLGDVPSFIDINL